MQVLVHEMHEAAVLYLTSPLTAELWAEILLLNTGPGWLRQERWLQVQDSKAKHEQAEQAGVETRGDEAWQ